MERMRKEKDMDTLFEAFIEEIRKEMKQLCGEGFTVRTMEMVKNNGAELKGIGISEKGSLITAVLYLEESFTFYIRGESVKRLAYKLYKEYQIRKTLGETELPIKDIEDFDTLRQKVTFRLVNKKMNAGRLTGLSYIPVTDLAAIFYVYLGDCRDGQLFFLITNPLMKVWGITLRELFFLAVENTQRLFPAKLDSMEEFIAKLIAEGDTPENVPRFSPEGMLPFYVLTNRYYKNGAAVILYPHMLKQTAEKLESDLLILPSSVHEIILLPHFERDMLDGIEKIIMEINEEYLSLPERLSDHAYLYRHRFNRLCMVLNGEETEPGFSLDRLYQDK